MNYSIVQDQIAVDKLRGKWGFKPFGEVIIDVTSGNIKIKKEDYQDIGLIPVVDQGKSLISGFINEDLAVEKGLDYIVFGDHTRIFKYIDFDFALGADGVKLLRPKGNEANTKYLYYFFQTLTIPDTGYNRHFKYLKNVVIPVPSLKEQETIVQTLDKAQSLIEKRKQALAKLDELVQAVFLDMFGDPINNTKFWSVHKLQDISLLITDGTHHSPESMSQGVPYVTAKHVKVNHVDFFSNPTYISEDEHTSIYRRCPAQKGDILYIKDGATTGIAAINPYEFEFSMLSSLALIKLNTDLVTPQYLVSYLNHRKVKEAITNNMSGAAIKRLTLAKIKEIILPVPSLEIQQKYSRFFEQLQSQKEKQLTQLQQLESNFQALLQKAFKGELTVKEGVTV